MKTRSDRHQPARVQKDQNVAKGQRLDTWLWASRFYKSRKLSSEEIKAGHVSLNGQRGKPSRLVRPDDVLKIRRIHQIFTVIVRQLSNKRLSAPLAMEMYMETDESRTDRQQKEELAKNQRAGLRFDRARPSKRDRQKMLKVRDQLPDIE